MIIILYRAVVVRCSGLVPLVTLGICRSYSMSFVLPILFFNITWVVSTRRYAVLSRYCIGFYNRCDTFCKVTYTYNVRDIAVSTTITAYLKIPEIWGYRCKPWSFLLPCGLNSLSAYISTHSRIAFWRRIWRNASRKVFCCASVVRTCANLRY